MSTEPVVKEVVVNAPVVKVWDAITKRNKMNEWYFDIPEFTAEEGSVFKFIGGTDEKKYLHSCRVIEVKNQKKISYTWRYEGYEGNTLVTFELTPQGEKTLVRLTHEGIETFPADNPDFAKERFAEGWDYIIGTSLKDYVEKPAR